jgi:N-methylhydantoinase B
MIDPVTLEVIKNGLASVADEMALVVMRSAYSPVVRDTMDYSTALCDRDGELVAQGLTLAVQLEILTIMRHVRGHFGRTSSRRHVPRERSPASAASTSRICM